RFLQPLENFGECALRQRVEKVEHQRVLRQFKFARVGEHGCDLPTALLRRVVQANVLFRRAMQLRKQLHSYYFLKRILRSHQQRASLAGTEIDERESIELDGQACHHLPKQLRIGWLIRRMKQSQQ